MMMVVSGLSMVLVVRRFVVGRLVGNTEADKIVVVLVVAGIGMIAVEVGVVLIGNWVGVGTMIGKEEVELVW